MSAPEFTPGQNIPIATLPNLRDIGGYGTADGRRVRTGLVFRSADTSRVTDGDAVAFGELGIRTVFDLRTVSERAAAPDRDLGVREVVLDVIADSEVGVAANLVELTDDPAGLTAALAGDRLAVLYDETYRQFVEAPTADEAYATLFTEIARSEDIPVLFHCTAGKDRTGWAAASLLLFLGVSEEDVTHDYLQTNVQLLPALQPVFDSFATAGGDADLLKSVYSVDRSYLDTALGVAVERYGSIEGYFADGLKLDADTLQAIRDRLTE